MPERFILYRDFAVAVDISAGSRSSLLGAASYPPTMIGVPDQCRSAWNTRSAGYGYPWRTVRFPFLKPFSSQVKDWRMLMLGQQFASFSANAAA
jgi:hypothetical protein